MIFVALSSHSELEQFNVRLLSLEKAWSSHKVDVKRKSFQTQSRDFRITESEVMKNFDKVCSSLHLL